MNKIAIPTLLLGVVMIAGIFAFMPVQEASTVHTAGATTLAADAITAAKIADNAILAVNINADAITAAKIADASIDAATFAAGAVNAAAIGGDAITALKIADNAISTEHITAAFTTELQSMQIVIGEDSTLNGGIHTCTSTAAYTVDYLIAALVDAEVITIGGTATATDQVLTYDLAAGMGANEVSGTVGGTAGETSTFGSSADGADSIFVLTTATGATATCTSA